MAIEILRPSAPGDECNVNGYSGCSDCPNHYLCVDEVVKDDLASEINSTQTPYNRDLYDLPASSGSGTINKITVYAYARHQGFVDQASLKIVCKSGGTVYEGIEITVSGIYTLESKEWALNPADSNAWEWADIDALQIGVSLRRSDTYYTNWTSVTQVYVEVDYSVTGWAGGDVLGVDIATIAEINGLPLADILEVNGVA